MLQITNTLQDEKTQSTYTLYSGIVVKGNHYTVLVVTGRHNYVSVTKKTNNPFGGKIGKDFKTFNDAAKHYKSPEMKTELLKIELGLL